MAILLKSGAVGVRKQLTARKGWRVAGVVGLW